MLGLMIFIAIVIFNFYIGFKVWQSNKTQIANKLFFLLIIELSLWMIFNYYSKIVAKDINNEALFLLIVRLVMAITSFIPYSLYLFSLVYPNKKLNLSPKKLFLGISWTVFNTLINLTPLVFDGTEIKNGELMPLPHWGMIFVFLNITLFFWAGKNFYQKSRQTKGLEKIQLSYLTFAFILMMLIIPFTNFILVIFFKNSNFLNFGIGSMSLVLTGFIGYALLKVRFSSIDFLLAKIFYYLILIFWLFVFIFITNKYFFFHPSAEGFFQKFCIHRFFAITAFIIWLSIFIKIYLNYEQRLIKIIVNHGLDWNKENKKLFAKISQEHNYEKIILETIKFFLLLIKNNGACIIGDFFNNGNFYIKGTADYQDKPEKIYLTCTNLWHKTQIFSPLIYEEISTKKNSYYRQIAQLMKKNSIGAIFPIMFYTDLRGILVLGHKLNGDPYFVQDIQFVEQTLNQIAIILNNTIIYQSSQNFNEYLQKRIDRATTKLVKTNQKLILADKMKDEFVSVASHELRTPMTAIKNYLWLVRANNTPEKIGQNQKYIEIALNSTDRLIEMVNNMLTISRIEGDRYAFNFEIVDLNKLAHNVYHELQPLAKNKNLTFSLLENKTSVQVKVDKNKIMEAMQNLVGNALKFTSQGEITITITVEKKTALFQVTDSGPGIEKADYAKLFKKFCRLENSYVKIKETGTGLGLYIAREIVRRHGGDITFTSEVNVGSTFMISLPLHQEKTTA